MIVQPSPEISERVVSMFREDVFSRDELHVLWFVGKGFLVCTVREANPRTCFVRFIVGKNIVTKESFSELIDWCKSNRVKRVVGKPANKARERAYRKAGFSVDENGVYFDIKD